MERTDSRINCKLCNKCFSQKSSYNRHVREQHLHPGLYRCQQCGLRFSKKYNLQVHKEHVHLKNIQQLKCSYCTGMFTKLAFLRRHVKAHHKCFETTASSNTTLDVKDMDAQTLAESVLKELKQLQQELEPSEEFVSNYSHKEDNLTASEKGTLETITVKDNLYPSGHFTSLSVQIIERQDKVKYLICEFCDKEFRKTYNYLRHRRIHTNVRPFVCVLCKKSFPTTAQLKTHCSTHKLDEKFGLFHRLYKCPKCNECFSSMRELDKHLCSVSSCCNIDFKCPHCLKSFKSLKTLLRHKHSVKDNELEMLKSILPTPLAFEKLSKIGENDLECNYCEIQIINSLALKQHKKRHENLFKNQCTKCHCSFVTETALKMHTKAHLNSVNFKCHYCSKYFQTAQNCRRHMLNHLKLLLDTNVSVQDDSNALKTFPTLINNENNGQTETKATTIIKTNIKHKTQKEKYASNELKYRCSECVKSFRYKAWLKKHFKYKHTTDLPHECSNCLKKFRTKQSLKSHILVHSTERVKLTCQVCGRKFASSKSLKLHLRIHTQEKPFTCDKCPKLFRTSGHLIQHRKSSHTVI